MSNKPGIYVNYETPVDSDEVYHIIENSSLSLYEAIRIVQTRNSEERQRIGICHECGNKLIFTDIELDIGSPCCGYCHAPLKHTVFSKTNWPYKSEVKK